MKRNSYWDIAKAIGIISVVIGHCSIWLGEFVYTYHLAIFFFVAGYLYNIKYSSDPYKYIGHKIKSTLPRYFVYCCIFILIHNFLINIGIYASTTAFYSGRDIISQVLLSSVFQGPYGMGGALWFIPFFVYSIIIFNFINYFINIFKKEKHKNIILTIICICLGLLGLKLTTIDFSIVYHLQTVFLVIPIIYIGYMLNKIPFEKLMKNLNIYIFSLCLLFILYVINYINGSIDISASKIISPLLFYPVTLAGIYMVLYISKIINKFSSIKNIFSTIGKYSFDIMALHFLMFKMVDFIYVHIFNIDIEILSGYPCSNKNLWVIYTIFGIVGSLIIVKIGEKLLKTIKSRTSKIEFLNMEEL